MYYIIVEKLYSVDSKLMIINNKYLVYPRSTHIRGEHFCVEDNKLYLGCKFSSDIDFNYSFNILAEGISNIRDYLFSNNLEDLYFNFEIKLFSEMRQ